MRWTHHIFQMKDSLEKETTQFSHISSHNEKKTRQPARMEVPFGTSQQYPAGRMADGSSGKGNFYLINTFIIFTQEKLLMCSVINSLKASMGVALWFLVYSFNDFVTSTVQTTQDTSR